MSNNKNEKPELRNYSAKELLPTLRYIRNKGGFPLYFTEIDGCGDVVKVEKVCQKTRSSCLAMLFMIFAAFNKENWPRVVKISNLQLSSWTGISRKSIPRYRALLMNWGIIDFKAPKGEKAAGWYTLPMKWWDKRLGDLKTENDNHLYNDLSASIPIDTDELFEPEDDEWDGET